MKVSALVLAGGRAERMAGRKAERSWRDGTLLSHVVEVARAVSDDVIVASHERSLRDTVARPDELTWVADDPRAAGEGPLGGLLAGLGVARHPWVWLLACDMPWLAPSALERLADACAEAPASTRALAHPGARGVEAFGSLVHRDVEAVAGRYADEGGRSLQGLFEAVETRLVEDPPMTPGIPTLPMLHNVNTLDELADARGRDASAPVPPRRTPER